MIKGAYKRNEELLELERTQLITRGIIPADVVVGDNQEDLEVLMRAYDDVSTIKSSGESIASRASVLFFSACVDIFFS